MSGEQIAETLGKVRAALAAADGYRETVTAALSFPLDGIPTDYITTFDTIYTGLKNADRFACSRTVTAEVRQGGASEKESEISGFADGILYLSDADRAVCCRIGGEDYLDSLGLTEEHSGFLSELGRTGEVSCTEENGVRTISFSGLTGEGADRLRDRFAAVPAFAAAEITGAQTSVRVGADGYPIDSVVLVSFDDPALAFSLSTAYAEWGSAEIALPDLTGYTETGDLTRVDACAELIYALLKTTDLSFSLERTTCRSVNGKETTERSETEVEAGATEAGYAYRCVERIGNVVFDRRYSAGVQTTLISFPDEAFDERSDPMTEAEAKAAIAALVNVGNFPLAAIDKVEVAEDGASIVFGCGAPDLSAYGDLFFEVDEAYASYTFRFADGALISLGYLIAVDGIGESGAISIEETEVVTFLAF